MDFNVVSTGFPVENVEYKAVLFTDCKVKKCHIFSLASFRISAYLFIFSLVSGFPLL